MHPWLTAFCFMALAAMCGIAAAAEVYLVFDNSASGAPYERLYLAGNWNKATGLYSAGWEDFERVPMFDDGQHADGAAGDHIWGYTADIVPGQAVDFIWSVDFDTVKTNGWIDVSPHAFRVESNRRPVIEFAAGLVHRDGAAVPNDYYVCPLDRPLQPFVVPQPAAHPAGLAIERLIRWQVKLAPGETGRVQVQLNDAAPAEPGDRVRLELFALDGERVFVADRLPEEFVTVDFAADLPEGGYRLKATIHNSGVEFDRIERVFSVVADTADDVRYGFYANFDSAGGDYVAKTDMLVDLYLNAVEYYDYFRGHGEYAPTQLSYTQQPFGGTVQVLDIQQKMEEARRKNILNVAYIAAYAAIPEIADTVPDSSLTNPGGEPLLYYQGNIGTAGELGGVWYELTAFAADTPWRTFLFDELTAALDDAPGDLLSFDGFEIDSYGYFGDYYSSGSSFNGQPVAELVNDLAGDVRALTKAIKPGGLVTRNNIAESAILTVYDDVDFLFVENWAYHKPAYADVVDMVNLNGNVLNQRLVSKSYPDDAGFGAAWPTANLRYLMGAHLCGGGSLMVAGEPREGTGQIGALNTLFLPDNQPQSAEIYNIIRNYNQHDAALYRINHGDNVRRRFGSAFALPETLIREFESADPEGYIAVCMLRTGANSRWDTLNSDPGELTDLPIEYPLSLDDLPPGHVPTRVLYGTPDVDALCIPRAIDFKFFNGSVTCEIPHLQYYGTLLIRHAPAPATRTAIAADDAGQTAYDDGWQDGDAGGFGWAGPWALEQTGPISISGHFAGSSTINGDGDQNADGDIDVDGRSWGMYASQFEFAEARRDFAALSIGSSLALDYDNGFVGDEGSVGIGLRNAAGEDRLEFFRSGLEDAYLVRDAAGITTAPLSFTDEGHRLLFTLRPGNRYELRVTGIGAGANLFFHCGELIPVSAGEDVSRLRVFHFNAGLGPPFDTFLNSLRLYASEAPVLAPPAAPPTSAQRWMLFQHP